MKICVYCASSTKIAPACFDEPEDVMAAIHDVKVWNADAIRFAMNP